MKEINCPYYWYCGQIFKIQELSKKDFENLQSAIKTKKTFLFLHCPKCESDFSFDAVQWKPTTLYSDPNLKVVEKKEKTTKQLTSILEKARVEIPSSYFDYLTSEKFNSEISIFADEDDFKLYDLNRLCEKIKVDGKPYLTIRQLKGFTNTLLEMIGEQQGQPFSFKELSDCLTIGSENTRILFIDNRDNSSLWVFYPDGGDFEKTSMTLDEIIVRKTSNQ